MSEKKSVQVMLETMRQRLEEDRAFLQSYMLDPNPDNRPAEEERIKDILLLSDEMEEHLTNLIKEKEEGQLREPLDQDFNLEYKTHTMGMPDDNDAIEDWSLNEEEPMAIEIKKSKKKKDKKKKGKKNKKNKK